MNHDIHAPVLLIIGSLSEAIKMGPIYQTLKRAGIPVLVALLDYDIPEYHSLLHLFSIVPHFYLSAPSGEEKDDLSYMQHVLREMQLFLKKQTPLIMLVQDDGISGMAASLAAYYLDIPVGHVEAGLHAETEESTFLHHINHRVISLFATYHFVSTPAAISGLLAQGVRREQIFCTGSSLADALFFVKQGIQQGHFEIKPALKKVSALSPHSYPIALVFLSEKNLAAPYAHALKTLIQQEPAIHWIVRGPYGETGEEDDNLIVSIPEDLTFIEQVYLINSAQVVFTNDEQVQEQAEILEKPVIFLNDHTHRMEGVLKGSMIVGVRSPHQLQSALHQLVSKEQQVFMTSSAPDDEGHASERIVAFIQARIPELRQKITQRRADRTLSAQLFPHEHVKEIRE